MANLIYERIISLIEQQGLTKAKVEKAAKLGNGTIESWNNGNPSINKLEAVANVLGCSIEELIRKGD